MSSVRFTLEGVCLHGDARPRLSDAWLRIEPAERVALIGPSGAGKSSLLAVLGLALRPDTGRILIDACANADADAGGCGLDPWQLRAAALRRLRACSHRAVQTPQAPPRQRVATAVASGLLPQLGPLATLAMLVRTPRRAAIERRLQAFGLAGRGGERLDRLSGGERQRVALAAALLSGSGALLLDEPLAALDPGRARTVLDLILDDATARGRTLVCALHQHALIDARFDRVIRLEAGCLIGGGGTDHLPGANAAHVAVAAGVAG